MIGPKHKGLPLHPDSDTIFPKNFLVLSIKTCIFVTFVVNCGKLPQILNVEESFVFLSLKIKFVPLKITTYGPIILSAHLRGTFVSCTFCKINDKDLPLS